MVFLGKKEQQRRKRMTKKFQAEIRSGRREPGLGFGFAAGSGGSSFDFRKTKWHTNTRRN